MGSVLVVVGPEGVELGLETSERGGRRLPGEELLEGLVETLDLAAAPRGGRGWSA